MFRFLVCRRDCNRAENERQSAEDEGLDEPDQQLQSVKRDGEDHGDKETGNQDQDLARRHVPEETEGETEHPG